MTRKSKRAGCLLFLAVVLSFPACGAPGSSPAYMALVAGGGSEAPSRAAANPPPAKFSLLYNVSGATGPLTLRNVFNGAIRVVVANGPGYFLSRLSGGESFHVIVETPPLGQTCLIQNSAGVASASMAGIRVICITASAFTYTIGGTVSGIIGAVIVRDGTQHVLLTSSDGSTMPFTFANRYTNGDSYSLHVRDYSNVHSCVVRNGNGIVNGANVTNVAVDCTEDPHPSGDPTYTVSTLTAQGDFDYLYGIALSPTNGYLYVSHWQGRIEKVHPTTGVSEIVFIDPIFENWAPGMEYFDALTDHIIGVAVDSRGRAHTADIEYGRVSRVDGRGELTLLHEGIAGSYRDLEFAPDGSLYAVSVRGTIEKIAPDGTVTNFYTGPEYLDALAVDPQGNLFAGSLREHRILKFTPEGVKSKFAGSGSCRFADGSGTSASFCSVRGLDADSSGNIFVADSGNNAVRKISPDGTVTTVAGTGISGSNDGSGATARLAGPYDLVVDSEGVITVLDGRAPNLRERIRRITPSL